MNKEISSVISSNIKFTRIDNGISQPELAQMIGTSQSNVSRWESGKTIIDAKSLYLMSKALNVPIDFFFRDHLADARERKISETPIEKKQLGSS